MHCDPGLSDHDAVIVSLVIKLCLQNQMEDVLLQKADWNAIRQSIASLSEEYFNLNKKTQSRNEIDNWQYILFL